MAELIRPTPKKSQIMAICGGDNGLLSSTYKGLYETPLKAFYPYLNLDELIAFEAGSWSRRQSDPSFGRYIKGHDIYDIFSEIYGSAFPWLNKNKRIPESMAKTYKALNPYQRNLEMRLGSVPEEAVEELKDSLAQPVKLHVFENQYFSEKRARGGDNSELVIMGFQPNSFPPSKRKGEEVYQKQYQKMVGAFASQIAKMISAYPTEIYPLQSFSPKQAETGSSLAEDEEPKQLSLF